MWYINISNTGILICGCEFNLYNIRLKIGELKMKSFEQKSINSYNEKADNYDNTFDGKFTVKFKQLLYYLNGISKGNKLLCKILTVRCFRLS